MKKYSDDIGEIETGNHKTLWVVATHPRHYASVTERLKKSSQGIGIFPYAELPESDFPDPARKKIIVSTRPRSGTNYFREVLNITLGNMNYVETPLPYESDAVFLNFFHNMEKTDWTIGHFRYSSLRKIRRNRGASIVYLYRDPRDYIISIIHHIRHSILTEASSRRTLFRSLSDDDCIRFIITGSLLIDGRPPVTSEGVRAMCTEMLRWIDDPQVFSMRYEDMVHGDRTTEVLTRCHRHMNATVSEEWIQILESANQFKNLTGGRKPGEEETTSHYRKGIVGDWKNYFTEEHKALFKEVAGEQLIKLGYEEDYNW